jgi:tetratricopeptide (TPR) repeat protein
MTISFRTEFDPLRLRKTARLGMGFMLVAGILLLAGCGTPPKIVRPDPELERNTSSASSAFAAGSVEKAAGYYRKALNRARLMDDAAAIGRNAYNLAACLLLLRQDEQARVLLEEAEAEFQRIGVNSREIPLLKIRLAVRAGKTDEALALAQAQSAALKTEDPFFIQYQVLLADLFCVKGNAAEAAAALAKVNSKDLAAAKPMVQAEAAQARARLALLERKPRAAGELQDTAAQQYQKAGQYLEMAQALDEAGRAYEAAGDPNAAVDRYYRAARSFFSAGQPARADGLVVRAILLADQAGVTAARKNLSQLQAEMNAARAVPASAP